MISYDAIVTEVTGRLGNRTDIGARIGRWINYSLFELLLNPRYSYYELDQGPVLFSTIANASTYNISDIVSPAALVTFWFILDLRDNTNSRRIRRVHYTEIDRVTQTTGQPVRYFRYGLAITFDPIPDAVYTIQMRYRQRPGDFISGSNLLLGTEWEEPVVALATIRGFEALDMRQKAQEQRQLLEAIMPTRMDVPTLEDADAEPTIQPSLIFPSF